MCGQLLAYVAKSKNNSSLSISTERHQSRGSPWCELNGITESQETVATCSMSLNMYTSFYVFVIFKDAVSLQVHINRL